MLRPTNTVISVFAHAVIILVFYTLGFAYYSSASEATSTDVTEDIEAEDISALIQSASQYVNETAKAIESENSIIRRELIPSYSIERIRVKG